VKKTDHCPLLTHVAITERKYGYLIALEGDIPAQRWRANDWDSAIFKEAGIKLDVEVRNWTVGDPGAGVGIVDWNKYNTTMSPSLLR